MRKEYDFTGARRAKDVPHLAKLQAEAAGGKTRITIMIDDDVLAAFRARAEREGKGYQTLINAALRLAVMPGSEPVTVDCVAPRAARRAADALTNRRGAERRKAESADDQSGDPIN